MTNNIDLTALASSTRSLELECIRTRKMLSYCRRRKSRGLPIEEAQMAEDIEREMKLYCEREREQEEPPPAYWLEFERETYAEYLETLKEELLEFEVQ